MYFDVRTVSFVAALNAFMLFLWLLSTFTRGKKHPGLNEWIWSAFSLFLGMTAISFRGVWHDSISIVVGNVCFIGSFALVDMGLKRFAGERPAFLLYGLTSVLIAAAFVYFTFYDLNLNMRIAVISGAVSFYCFRLAWYTFKHIKPLVLGKTGLLITVFVTLGIWDVVRVILTFTFEPSIEDFMQSSIIQSATVMTFNAASILTYAGLVSIHAQWLEKELITIEAFLPICASCKKIRDDNGYWKQVEEYISHHIDVKMTHTICPDCIKILYPDLMKDEPEDK
ncbi:hypothetical protein K1X84_07240 [bacterium]|nr:hypothetical protein [bacterium]